MYHKKIHPVIGKLNLKSLEKQKKLDILAIGGRGKRNRDEEAIHRLTPSWPHTLI